MSTLLLNVMTEERLREFFDGIKIEFPEYPIKYINIGPDNVVAIGGPLNKGQRSAIKQFCILHGLNAYIYDRLITEKEQIMIEDYLKSKHHLDDLGSGLNQ